MADSKLSWIMMAVNVFVCVFPVFAAAYGYGKNNHSGSHGTQEDDRRLGEIPGPEDAYKRDANHPHDDDGGRIGASQLDGDVAEGVHVLNSSTNVKSAPTGAVEGMLKCN